MRNEVVLFLTWAYSKSVSGSLFPCHYSSSTNYRGVTTVALNKVVGLQQWSLFDSLAIERM